MEPLEHRGEHLAEHVHLAHRDELRVGGAVVGGKDLDAAHRRGELPLVGGDRRLHLRSELSLPRLSVLGAAGKEELQLRRHHRQPLVLGLGLVAHRR